MVQLGRLEAAQSSISTNVPYGTLERFQQMFHPERSDDGYVPTGTLRHSLAKGSVLFLMFHPEHRSGRARQVFRMEHSASEFGTAECSVRNIAAMLSVSLLSVPYGTPVEIFWRGA